MTRRLLAIPVTTLSGDPVVANLLNPGTPEDAAARRILEHTLHFVDFILRRDPDHWLTGSGR